MKMIQFILDNKEWLFSGIGVTILILAITLIKKAFRGKKEQVPIEETQEIVIHLNPSSDTEITKNKELIPVDKISPITFSHIEEAITNAPPLQRDDVKKHFIGIKVEWETYLKAASKDDEGIVTLRLSPGTEIEDRLYTIRCKVAIEDYRELGILPEGTRIRINGEIVKADRWDVELTKVRLYFLENNSNHS